MSALGQKRTFAPQKVMSALPPKADMCSAQADVRFVPEADIAASVCAVCCLVGVAAIFAGWERACGMLANPAAAWPSPAVLIAHLAHRCL